MPSIAADASDGACFSFWKESPEKGDLNQYWFSQPTIQVLVDQVVQHGPRAALVSCPSIYFSLPVSVREVCKVLEYDRAWEHDPGFVFYDFNEPEIVPPELHHAFDLVIIDPPYITREVWSKYALTAKLLLCQGCEGNKPRGRLLCTSIAENAPMMRELLEVEPRRFRPSIPNLVYQYHIYTNYSSGQLDAHNEEVDPDGDVPMPSLDKPSLAWEDTYGALKTDRADEIAIKPASSITQAAFDHELSTSSKQAEVQVEEEELQDFGPACNAVIALRDQLGDLKKGISGLDQLVEIIIQQSARLEKAPEEKRPAIELARSTAVGNRDAALAGLQKLACEIDRASSGTGVASCAGIVDILISEATKPMLSKKDFFAFSTISKKYSQSIFKRQSALLQQIKELKKEYRASVTASSTSQHAGYAANST
jgi:hypothetical protein